MLYRLDADAAQIAHRFDARRGEDPWISGPVAPGGFAPIITAGREAVAGPRAVDQPRRMVPRLWGVPPPPSAGQTGRGVLTVSNPHSPFWIGNLRNSEFRCLVPATAFMAWGKGHDAAGRRRQLWIGAADQPLFAMAGVWKDSEIPSFAILTCESNATLRAEGLDRMPVLLPADDRAADRWLRGGWDRAQELATPYPSSFTRVEQGPAPA